MKKAMINLIPQNIKDERRNQKAKQTMYLLSLIPLSMYGYLHLQMNDINKDINALNEEISNAKYLESQIKYEETTLFKDMRILSGLSKNSFPLHRFLLFMGVEIPEDMRLYTVVSDNILKTSESEEKTDDTQNKPLEEGEEGELEEEELILSEEDQKSLEEFSDQLSTETNDEDKQQKLEDIFIEHKVMYIRGATLSVNSIGKFMQDLEKNEFIEKVDIQDIENYYNGAQSYKFFELTVKTK